MQQPRQEKGEERVFNTPTDTRNRRDFPPFYDNLHISILPVAPFQFFNDDADPNRSCFPFRTCHTISSSHSAPLRTIHLHHINTLFTNSLSFALTVILIPLPFSSHTRVIHSHSESHQFAPTIVSAFLTAVSINHSLNHSVKPRSQLGLNSNRWIPFQFTVLHYRIIFPHCSTMPTQMLIHFL